jgi:GNAT superfamily N-acetyltransferase
MNESEDLIVSELKRTPATDLDIQTGISFFEPHLRYFIDQTLDIGGDVYLAWPSTGPAQGIFTYDLAEKTGTIYTKSQKVFDRLYNLKHSSYLFAEMDAEREHEIYDIYCTNLKNPDPVHRFGHEVAIATEDDAEELERYMSLTHPGINKRWVRVALKSRDKCFIVRLKNEIAGLGWVSFVNDVGRIHSLYVLPQFRRMGLGEDILFARLLWLRSRGARSAYAEISRLNPSSSRIAMKGGMRVAGQVFLYIKSEPDSGTKVMNKPPTQVLGAPH